MNKGKLHIVSFDVPYPPNYGGIIDVFFKMKALSEYGAEIIFHSFYYDDHNPPSKELNKYCAEVHYYKRKKSFSKTAIGKLPYIVSSRNDQSLLENLIKDGHPILFEGLHSCFYLNHPALLNRKRFVRAHNIEHEYYRLLSKWEESLVKRKYLLKEADRLLKFESELKGVDGIFSISKSDVPHFEQYAPTFHIPAFYKKEVGREKVNKGGVEGKYILFHGNLSVKENEESAKFILNEIAPHTDYTIVIAGKEPSSWLKNEVKVASGVLLVESPPSITMESLIQHANINLLITFQKTGVKLKLLNALNVGQHVIINPEMDDANVFAEICHVCDGPQEILDKINDLMLSQITEKELEERNKKFNTLFDNEKNARKIMEIVNS